MKLEYLEYLVDFAETRSVGATAGRFYLSTQGMNRALHQLEKESGYVLFQNEGGYLKFTRAGMVFVERARAIVGEYRMLQQAMRGIPGDHGQESDAAPLRLLATPASTRYLLPFLDLQAPRAFPFEVLLREESLASCVEILKATAPTRTLALVSLPCTEKYLGLVQETTGESRLAFGPLIKSDVIALVSTSSQLSRKETFVTPRDLEGVKCGYLLDEMLLDYVDDFVRDSDMRTITSNLSILEEQIATNQIVTFMARLYLATRRLPEGVTALPCPNSPEVLFGFLATSDVLVDPDVGSLCQSVQSTLLAKSEEERFSELYRCVF